MPILQRLSAQKPQPGAPRVIRALVLTPTRELALQISDSFKAYGHYLRLRTAVIFGGVSQNPQVDELRRGVEHVFGDVDGPVKDRLTAAGTF